MSLLRRRMMMAKKPSGVIFYIEGNGDTIVEHRAKQGMTWREWVSSDYNTGGYLINTRYNIISKSSGRLEIGVKYHIGGHFVGVDDLIENKYEYYYG